MADTIALIVAAGASTRAGGTIPKQYRELGGRTPLALAAEAFLRHPAVRGVRVAIRAEDRVRYDTATAGLALMDPVIGGGTRQDSVRLGLESLAAEAPARVLIHDGARPFASAALIGRVVDALEGADAAAPLLPLADTLRRKTATGYDIVPRGDLFRAQTPQGFRFAKILEAHRRFAHESVTDDLTLAERAGLAVTAVAGEEANMKLTEPADFALAERLAANALPDIRTGTGFDVHRFAPGDHLFLCGIRLAHDHGLEGHSDADCGLHALTDAILGALGAADIGTHFPPGDERWRGAASHVFLAYAGGLVREAGGVISHADVTLICERPKIAPHREAMRARIAEILGLSLSRVSVKATTTEGLGFTGRREGIAAQAVATIRLP
jgi:2-C-methyl-D-erythritol 4-phosphate cytidylyltransferase/2-C-methyl-D-erythritol 2,4-cyclodiphosphate synthase